MNQNLLRALALPKLRQRRNHKPLLVAVLGVLSAIVLAMTFVVGATLALYRETTAEYPPLDQQVQVRAVGITAVFDRNGEPLGVLTNPNSAISAPVGLDRISPWLVAATVSTEDNNFWAHPGVDAEGLIRAAWTTYVKNGDTTGGSTITQQVVKGAYFTTDCTVVDGLTQCVAPRTIERKMKELALAIDAEERYSKEQILTWYLNSISYAGRYVGAEAAAQGYFHKPAAELTLAESAVLAGLPSAPTRYNPRTNCTTNGDNDSCLVDELGRTVLAGDAKARQEYVLDLLAKHGRISAEEAEEAKNQRVYVWSDVREGRASAFIDDQVEPRLVRLCQAGLLPKLEGAKDCATSVHTAGYKVTTTLDWELNTAASAMLNQYVVAGLAAGCDCHNGSIVTIEPSTGQVIVYVPNIDPTWVSDPRVAGGIDQNVEIHQPGSSFKPAVYLTWFDALNKTPMSTIWDTNPINLIDKPKTPDEQVAITNPGRNPSSSQGLITARAALGGSQNVPAFRAATEAGVDNIISMAKALGITTLDQRFDPTFRDHDSVIYGPAIATGGANVRPIDMAYMEATISNIGVMVGVPTYASTLDPKNALSVSRVGDDQKEKALAQRDAFAHGHLRLPGTRTLDPVVVLKVESSDGDVLYDSASDVTSRPVVNAGSVWLLHSIMSDCTARFLIWPCGTSNDDLSLDSFVNGVKIPGGVKTGTQQGATALDTLETWMTGYSRYASTVVWIGNADKSPVRDGPAANYASANTTVRLFKNWMGAYHAYLQKIGVFQVPAGFDELKPKNVTNGPFQSATTERGMGGGCGQRVTGWQRTDIDYLGGDCLGKWCVPLPAFKKELAVALASSRGIPGCGVALAPSPSPSPTETVAEGPGDAAGAPAVTPKPSGSSPVAVSPTPKGQADRSPTPPPPAGTQVPPSPTAD